MTSVSLKGTTIRTSTIMGERLSHAVGCAFAACLERKQRREKECGVTASFDASRTSFVREGSFRVNSSSSQQGGSGDRDDIMKLQDKKKGKEISESWPTKSNATFSSSPPEGAASPVERPEPGGPHAIPRRHAPIEQLVRQGSFRGFPALSQKNSPFKRQLSLRLNDLPSTLQRKTDFQAKNPGEGDSSINALCSQINTSFTKPSDELFSNTSSINGPPACTVPPVLPPPPAPLFLSLLVNFINSTPTFCPATSNWVQTDSPLNSPPPVSVAMQMQSGHKRTPSEAERWLEEVAKAVKAQQQTPPPGPAIPTIPGPPSMSNQPMSNQAALSAAPVSTVSIQPVQPAFVPMQTYMPGLASSMTYPNASVPVVGITPSQMVANVFCTATGSSGAGGAMGSVGGGAKVGALGTVGHHSFAGAPSAVGQTGGFSTPPFSSTQPLPTAINGLPPHSSSNAGTLGLQNGTSNSGGNGGSASSWPPEGSQLTAPAASDSQEAERFEAKWAALESKPASQQPGSKATTAAANPFSNDLQKTFEIEL
uniref:NUMB like endocytic adaptor protein n=1 Tax=Myripristis murdjan TaxID=586833 RepID=A0A667XRT8_9TELE